jgi:hypothetical protein
MIKLFLASEDDFPLEGFGHILWGEPVFIRDAKRGPGL